MNSLVFSVSGRRLGIVAIAVAVSVALLVGISRIYLGYHYLSDVVAGWFAGLLWVLIVAAAFRLPMPSGRPRQTRADDHGSETGFVDGVRGQP